jgi:O-antigen ligase
MQLGLKNLPFLVKLVAVATIIACIGGKGILGYQISGFAWLIPLLVSLFLLFARRGKIRFPIRIWMPWILIVIIYQLLSDMQSFQRSIMLICPIFIGMAVSKFTITEKILEDFAKLYKYMALSLFTVVIFKSGISLTGMLPKHTGLAAEVMTGALICALLAGGYAYGRKHELGWWFALATIPIISVTRMGMIATSASLPMTLAPMNIVKRGLFVLIILFIGFNLFFTERIQNKMFYSGRGTIQDVKWDNPDFATSGRKVIWELMQREIKRQPWFGHGANASESFVSKIIPGLSHPHNDWLRLQFDYGYIGTVLFGLCLLIQLIHALLFARRSTGNTKLLFQAGASSIVIFVLIMFTDNIILYVAFFGNLQFTILGLAYASYVRQQKEKEDSTKIASEKRRIKIRW